MKNLYVGNLPHSTTEAELRGVFEAHGAVEKVSLVTDRETGRSRGFAFVEMASQEDASKAITMFHQKDFQGRALTVNEARPREERPAGGRLVEDAEVACAGLQLLVLVVAERPVDGERAEDDHEDE